jgi:hypothetical protein
MPPPLTVSAVLFDAGEVYRLLFRRSFPIALGVYALIGVVEIMSTRVNGDGAQPAGRVLAFVLSFAGPLLVQGALVKIVCSVHEGTRPEPALALLRDANSRLLTLVGASLIYSFGAVFGLLLLIVPGLLVLARWSLMAPAIMLEGRTAFSAKDRSREIVRGQAESGLGDRTWFAFWVVVIAYAVTGIAPGIAAAAADAWAGSWAIWIVLSALAVPFQAHALSVLYYRLVDPQRPAIDPQVKTWASVWAGPLESA